MKRQNSLLQNLLAFTAASAVVMASTAANAAAVLIVNGLSTTSEIGTTNEITSNLSATEIAAGNTPTVVDTVAPLANLSTYAAVWDIRFANSSPITASDIANYLNYLEGGGSLFAMGENSGFSTRNNSVFSLIGTLGGGSVGFSNCADGFGVETVIPPLTGPNPVTSFNYLAPGAFSSLGTGTAITQAGSCTSAAAWGKGTLANALTGDFVSVLDVNFMEGAAFVGQASQNFLANLVGFVDNGAAPPGPPAVGVPEPVTLSLFGAGLAGVFGLRRRRRKS